MMMINRHHLACVYRDFMMAAGLAAAVVATVLVSGLLDKACGTTVESRTITLDNTKLPLDTSGNPLLTGEADILVHPSDGHFYVYFNNWGGCPGVDCCGTQSGCASCCFTSHPFTDPCVYTANHSVVVYRTPDFASWEYRGVALNVSARKAGVEFRPHVVYNPSTKLFVMWYEDRWSGQRGFAVATSATADGPFTTLHDTVPMTTHDKIGDFDIFVDVSEAADGTTKATAYHVRTGFVVEELDETFTKPTGRVAHFSTPKPAEGPVFFKRGGHYYIFAGTGCCACRGGSSIYVFTAPSPLGPFTYRGDIGSNQTSGFDPHSPWNYVTRAQASKVVPVPSGTGSDTTYLWMGNQWVTSQYPGRPRNHDLLYWWPLEFEADGNLTQVRYQAQVQLKVPA
eukprot:m.102301 g.102301  ORF g.102301 m.102301 type:complete len:397 (+) comp15503_c0_seq1:66-1256(+)